MTGRDFEGLSDWFYAYCRSFYSVSEEDQRNILLKEIHTGRVVDNMRAIVSDSPADPQDALLAQAVALLHDVGRFLQYARYKTFLDSASVNHGALGAQILAEAGILSHLPQREREIIVHSVKFHNTYRLPDLGNKEVLPYLRLIRDADKLDIWRVFIEYYETPAEDRPSAVGLGLVDRNDYSGEIVACLEQNRIASLSMLRTFHDFKLMQLSWVFDLNFRASFRILRERGYLGRITATLPRDGVIERLSSHLREYIDSRAVTEP